MSRVNQAGRPEHLDPSERTRLGAWYTPAPVVADVCDLALDPVIIRRGPAGLTIIDPACGVGNFLVEARARLIDAGADPATVEHQLFGVDIDPIAVERASERLPSAHLVVADGLTWAPERRFDVVVTNPPFQSPLKRRTTRSAAAHPGTRYADVAALFIDRWSLSARESIGTVMPLSFLAANDARRIRDDVASRGVVTLSRVKDGSFDANVHAVLVAVALGEPDPLVAEPTWSPRIADQYGIPVPPIPKGTPRLASIATATADFRDQYYGLIDALNDDGIGVALITTSLIGPNGCRWGERPVRYAKQIWHAPSVDLDRLSPAMRQWAERRLVPKVLVATQTTTLRAVIDRTGRLLPAVPVITVIPHDGVSLDEIHATITAPQSTAWANATYLGTALTPSAIKLSARQILEIPLA